MTQAGESAGTRGQVARLILELGPCTAATIGGRLGLTPAAIRRHLDNLLAEGLIETRTARTYGNRGRGRPAKVFVITDAGRSAFEHAYDDLATGALRFLAETAGPESVTRFARRQLADLERRYAPAVGQGDLAARVGAFAVRHQGPAGLSTVTTVAPARLRRDYGGRSAWARSRPFLVALLVVVIVTAVTLILLQSAGVIHLPFLGGGASSVPPPRSAPGGPST